MQNAQVKFKRLDPDAQLPQTWTEGSVGMDLHAFALTEERRPNTILLPPRTTRNIGTGLLIEPPPGYFLMVCSRSGVAKDSIFVANQPGIIDPDYRGEVRILLYNGSHESRYIKHGDRIAQLVAVPATLLEAIEVSELSQTDRGELGFGSTGGL